MTILALLQRAYPDDFTPDRVISYSHVSDPYSIDRPAAIEVEVYFLVDNGRRLEWTFYTIFLDEEGITRRNICLQTK